MAINAHGGAAHTFSYYGWSNFFFLNVGFHNEHHDFSQVRCCPHFSTVQCLSALLAVSRSTLVKFVLIRRLPPYSFIILPPSPHAPPTPLPSPPPLVQVPWTKLPQLRAMVGDKWYPDTAAYKSRGILDVYHFIFDPKCSLANFYSAERAPARVAAFKKDGAEPAAASTTATTVTAAAAVPAARDGAAAMLAADEVVAAPSKEAAKGGKAATGRAARRPDLSVAGDDAAVVAAASSRSGDGESGSDSGSDVAPAVPSPVVCEPVSEAEPAPLPEEDAAAAAPSARRRVTRKQA